MSKWSSWVGTQYDIGDLVIFSASDRLYTVEKIMIVRAATGTVVTYRLASSDYQDSFTFWAGEHEIEPWLALAQT